MNVSKPIRILVFLLFGVFLGAAGSVALGATGLWWRQAKSVASAPAANSLPIGNTEPAASAQQAKPGDAPGDVKERVDLYARRADDIERLLSLLVAVSTIYAIALGVNAYAQTKEAGAKVDKLTAEMQKSAEETKQEIVKLFPLFEEIDRQISLTMNGLLTLLPRIDVSEKNYHDLSIKEREEILYYEKSIAATELFNVRSFRETRSGIFHGLGNFYALKYAGEHRREDEARERAIFYLEKAIDLHPKNTGALNDRGYLALSIYADPNFEEAKKFFKTSLKVDPEQQRPLYNLAWISHKQNHFDKSVAMISQALETAKWQMARDAARVSDLYYQRACSLVQMAMSLGVAERAHLFRKAVDDLMKVLENPNTDWKTTKKTFEDDVKTDGDLYPLLGNEQRADEVFRNFRDAI